MRLSIDSVAQCNRSIKKYTKSLFPHTIGKSKQSTQFWSSVFVFVRSHCKCNCKQSDASQCLITELTRELTIELN